MCFPRKTTFPTISPCSLHFPAPLQNNGEFGVPRANNSRNTYKLKRYHFTRLQSERFLYQIVVSASLTCSLHFFVGGGAGGAYETDYRGGYLHHRENWQVLSQSLRFEIKRITFLDLSLLKTLDGRREEFVPDEQCNPLNTIQTQQIPNGNLGIVFRTRFHTCKDNTFHQCFFHTHFRNANFGHARSPQQQATITNMRWRFSLAIAFRKS